MNSKYFGDSYDLVKRVLLEVVSALGLEVYAEPLFTDYNPEVEQQYYKLIKAKPFTPGAIPNKSHCLFMDPDTGLHENKSLKHVTYEEIKEKCDGWALVIVFDQSFSRREKTIEVMKGKLGKLAKIGTNAFYYASHTNFLFASTDKSILKTVGQNLLGIGIPNGRIIK